MSGPRQGVGGAEGQLRPARTQLERIRLFLDVEVDVDEAENGVRMRLSE